MTILLVAATLVATFWLLVALLPARRFPRDHLLRRAVAPSSSPRVAVLVPARDEAAVLPETLPTLLAQEYPDFEVVLIDDASSDGTAALARELARTAPSGRLRVVEAGDKPPGWAGKMHALARGAAVVAEDGSAPTWLLLTDADIRHPPGSIAALVGKAQRGGYDLVSVMARLSTETGWERLLIPPFVFFFHLLYPFREVSHRASRVAAAAGGCVLVRAAALAEAGGFAAIRGALIDDVALARLLKGRRRRPWLGLDPSIESVRRYSLGDLWRMVARSAFVQLGYRYWVVPLVVLGLGLFFIGPPLVVAAAAAAIASAAREGALVPGGGAPSPAWWTLALGGLAWCLEAACLLPWVRHHRVRGAVGWSFLFPVASVLYAAMTAGSAWDHLLGRGSAWKGRGYEPGGPPD